MKIHCFFFGCSWDSGVEMPLGRELVRMQVCQRCRAHRVVSV
ncbi:PSPA7_2676 family Cys-rich small protein [Metapseudomonas furukawaii]